MRQGCNISPHLFNVYTESVMRDAEVEERRKNSETKADEKRIESAELWIYRRGLPVSWTGTLSGNVVQTFYFD